MPFVARPPTAWLAPWVERLWTSSGGAAHERERILPSGTFELVVDLAHDEIVVHPDGDLAPTRCSSALLAGGYERAFTIEARAHQAIVGVHFRPGGAARFFGVAASEIAGLHVDLDLLWRDEGRSLRDRLASAATPEARFSILEHVLRRKLDVTRARPEVTEALRSLGRTRPRVDTIARASGLGLRRFRDLFTSEVGLAPKRFARIVRMQDALARARGRAPRWAEIATAAGYVDQSHLVRDVRALTGMTPTEWASQQDPTLIEHHVHAPAADSSKTVRARGPTPPP